MPPREGEEGNSDEEREPSAIPYSAPHCTTIAEVMAWARERVAAIAGVKPEAIKLDLKVEY